jgi:hypothetical protein
MLLAFGLIDLGVRITLLDGRGGQTNRYLSIAVVGKKGNIIPNKCRYKVVAITASRISGCPGFYS